MIAEVQGKQLAIIEARWEFENNSATAAQSKVLDLIAGQESVRSLASEMGMTFDTRITHRFGRNIETTVWVQVFGMVEEVQPHIDKVGYLPFDLAAWKLDGLQFFEIHIDDERRFIRRFPSDCF